MTTFRPDEVVEPIADWDSGFCVFAGEPDDCFESSLVCLDCLLEERPEIARGLDFAREHGEAIRNGDEWTTRVTAANG